MSHAKFYLRSYAHLVQQQSSNESQEQSLTLLPNNLSNYTWNRIDGSWIERDLAFTYNGETGEIKVLYKDSTKEYLRVSTETETFKVYFKDTTAMFLIARRNLSRQFKIRFMNQQTANDFFNLMSTIIRIERLDMVIANSQAQAPPNDSTLPNVEEQECQKAIEYAYSQPSQLTQSFSSHPCGDTSNLDINDDILNQSVLDCLSDPEFPTFMLRVRAMASNILNNM